MGRNSKKNRGSKANVAGEQGLKGAAALASSSTNVTTPPSRPARTAKHKVRKSQSQPSTTTLSQGSDTIQARSSRSITEPQPSALASLPTKDVKREAEKQGISPSDTPTSGIVETSSTSGVTIPDLPLTDNSNEREDAPISVNLSDSYDSSSSSSETEVGVQSDTGPIPSIDNVAEMLKIEQQGRMEPAQILDKLHEDNEKPKGQVADKSNTSMAMDNKKLSERVDGIEHSSSIAAISTIRGSFSSLSTCLQDKLEIEVSGLASKNTSEVQADNERDSSEVTGLQENIQGVKIYHQEQHSLLESPGSCFRTVTVKQMILEDRSLGPGIAQEKKDIEPLDAEPETSEQSRQETTLSVSVHEMPGKSEQKTDQEPEPDLVTGSFDEQKEEEKDERPEQKDNEQANFAGKVESASSETAAHQILASLAENNEECKPWEGNTVNKSTDQATREANLHHIEEVPPYSIQESTSVTNANQLKQNAWEPIVNTRQHQHGRLSEQSISSVALQQNVSQVLEAKESALSLQSEEGQAPHANEQPLHTQVEQNYKSQTLIITETDTFKDEVRVINEESQPLTDKEESTTSIIDAMPVSVAEIITQAQQDMQERHSSHAETLLSECQEDVEARNTENSGAVTSKSVEMEGDSKQAESKNESPLPELQMEMFPAVHQLKLGADAELAGKPETESVILSQNEEVAAVEINGSVEDRSGEDLEAAVVDVDKTLEVGDISVVTEGHATIRQESQRESVKSDQIALVDDDYVKNDAKECEDTAQEQHASQQQDNKMAESQAAQKVAPEEIPSSERHNPLNSEQQIIEEGDPEAKATTCKDKLDNTWDEYQGKPDNIYTGSVGEEYTENSVENKLKELEVGEIEAEREKKECQDKEPNQLHGGTVTEGHATSSVESDKEKLEIVQPEVEGIMLHKKECGEEKVDQAYIGSVSEEHKDANSLENKTEKPDKGESQVEGVILDTTQESQEEKPKESFSESIDEEGTRSVEIEMEKVDVRDSEVAIAVHEEKECQEEKPTQLNFTTNCMEKKPEEKEPEVASATLDEANGCQEATPDQVDRGYICTQGDTSPMENQLEVKEPKVDSVAEKENPGDKLRQLDDGAVYEGHATDSDKTETEHLQVSEPEITLNLERPPETPDHDEATSICDEHQTTDSLANPTEELDMGDSLVVRGNVTQKHSKFQEEEQLGKSTVRVGHATSSAESDLEEPQMVEPEIQGITLHTEECGEEEKYDQAHVGCVNEEHENADSLEQMTENSDEGEPQVESITLDKARESQEEKPNESNSGSMCEEHIRYVENEMETVDMEDSEVAIAVHNEKNFQEEKPAQEKKPEVEAPEVQSAILSEEGGCQGATPDQVDRGYFCKEDDKSSMGNQIENPEVKEHHADDGAEKESQEDKPAQLDEGAVCEGHPTNSVETEMEHLQVEESGIGLGKEECLQETPDHDVGTFLCQEHQTTASLENAEKFDVGDPLVGGIKLPKDSECREGGHTICEGHATNSIESHLDKPEMVEQGVKGIILDKEERSDQKLVMPHVGSVCEEHKTTNSSENEIEKSDVGEPQVEGVTLDKDKESQEEKPNESYSESEFKEHTRSLEKVEKVEVEKSEVAIAVHDPKECQEEKPTKLNDTTNSVEKKLEIVKLEEENVCQEETPHYVEGSYVCNKDQPSSMGDQLEKPEMTDPKVDDVMEKESQEDRHDQLDAGATCEVHVANSVETDMEHLQVEEPDATLDKEESLQAHATSFFQEHQTTDSLENAPEQVDMGDTLARVITLQTDSECQEGEELGKGTVSEGHAPSVCQEHQTTDSLVNAPEKVDMGDALAGVIMLQKDSECQEGEKLGKGTVSGEHAPNSVEIDLEKLETHEPRGKGIMLDKEECHEEKPDGAHVGSVHIEHKTADSFKNETEQSDEGEPQLEIVTLDKAQESHEEKPEESYTESAYKEQARSVKSEVEEVELGKSDVAIAVQDEKECHEEKPTKLDDNCVEKKSQVEDPEVESAMLQEENGCQEETLHQVDRSYICNEDEPSPMGDETEPTEMKEPKVDSVAEKDNQENHLDQLDAGALCGKDATLSVESGMENLQVGQQDNALYKEECPQEKPDHAHAVSVCQEHQTTNSLENESDNLDVRDSLVGSVTLQKDSECQEDEQLGRGTVCEGHAENYVESEMEKLEMVQPEVEINKIDNKECWLEKLGQAHIGSACEEHETLQSLENETEKPDEGEPQVEGVTLDKAQESEEEKPDKIVDESVCQEHTRSVEQEVDKVEVDESEGAIAVDDKNECQEEKYSQLNDTTNRMEKKPAMEEPEVEKIMLQKENACPEETPDQVDTGYVCKEDDTRPKENQLEKPDVNEPKVDSVDEKESQKDEPDQIDAEALGEGHATNSVENEMEDLQVEVPEKCAQEKPDHDPATSVSQAHQTTDSLENATEKLNVGNLLVGVVTLQKDSEYQEEKQSGKRPVCEGHAINSVESEMKKLEVVEPEVKGLLLDKEECQEEKLDQAHLGSVHEEHETTNSLENEIQTPYQGEPAVEVVEEEKPDEIVDESVCEEHTQSVEQEVEKVEVEESEVAIAVDNEKNCKEEKYSQLNDTTNCMEKKPAVEEPEVESATLQEENTHSEETLDQVDRGYICKEDDTSSMENQLEKLQRNQPKVDSDDKKEGQKDAPYQLDAGALCEGHATNSVETEIENLQVGEPEIALDKEECPQEKPDHDHATSVCQEHRTTESLENATEMLNVGDPLQKDSKCQEDAQLGKGSVCEGHALNSVESETKKLEMVEPEVEGIIHDKEECQEEKLDQAHVGSVHEEHKTPNYLENEREKPDMGESPVQAVTIDKTQESEEEKSNESVGGYLCEEHTSSVEQEVEKAEVEDSEVAFAVDDEKECHEEKSTQVNGTTNSVEKKPELEETEVESATLNECPEATPDQLDRGYICKEDETSSMGNKQQKPEVKEPKVDSVAEKDSQEEKPDQLDEGAVCEEHATNSIETETENLQEEPEITLDEECLLEKPDHDNATPASQEHQTTDCLEYTTEKLDVEPLVGGTTLQEDEQFGKGTISATNFDEIEMEMLAEGESEVKGIRLDKKECLQEKPNHAQGDSQNHKDKTTDSQENAIEKLDMGEPLLQGATFNKDQESQENKTDQQLHRGIVSEGHATKSIDSEMEKLPLVEEPEADVITFVEEQCMGSETQQAYSDCVGEEYKTRDFLENVKKLDQEVEGVTLDNDQVSEEEKPDVVDRDSVCQDQTKSSEKNGIEELEVGESYTLNEFKKESECPEVDIINSMESGVEQPNVEESEVETATFAGTKESHEEMSDHMDSVCVFKELEMASVENELETPEIGEPEVGKEEDKSEVGKPMVNSIALEKEECEEGKHHQGDGSFACEEHQNTDVTEHAKEKHDMGEPHVDVTLEELQEEIPDQADSDLVNPVHPTSSLENKTEELELEESKTAVTPCEEKEYEEEKPHQLHVCGKHSTNSEENAMDRPEVKETQAESASMEEEHECEAETIDQVEIDLVSKEHDTKSVKASELGDPECHATNQQKKVHQEHEADPVSDFGNEQLVANSAEEELEKFEVGEPQVCLALEDKETYHEGEFGKADHVSVNGEQIPAFLATELKEVEVGRQEAGIVFDRVNCQEGPGYRGSGGEEHITNVLENVLQTSKVAEPDVGSTKLDEEKQSLPVEDGYQHRKISSENDKENLEMEGPEADNPTLGKVECQEDAYEEHTTSTFEKEAAETDSSPKLLDKSDQIEVWEQHPIMSVENEMEKLDARDIQEEYHQKEECQEKYSVQLRSSGSVSEEYATNTAESEIEKLEMEDAEVESAPINNEEWQEEKPDGSHSGSICEPYTNRPVENTEKLEVEDAEVQSDRLDENKTCQMENPDLLDCASLCGEQTTESLEQETKKPEVSVTAVEGIMMDEQEECQREKPDQIKSSFECEKHATDSEENQKDKLELSQTELEGMEVQEESEECQEEITNEVNEGSACETEKPEVEGVPLQVNKECQQGGKPDEVDGSRPVSLHTANSEENNIKKNELGVPEVEDDVLGKGNQCQSEQPYQVENNSACEEHATHTKEDDIVKLEVNQPEVEGVALDEKEECQVEGTDINNGLVHEKDSEKEKQEDPKLELAVALEENEESQEAKPDQVTCSRSMSEVQTTASLTDVMQQPEVKKLEQEEISLDENQGGESEQIHRGCVEMHTENAVENGMDTLAMDLPRIDGLALQEKEESLEENPEQVDTKLKEGEQTIYSMQTDKVGQLNRTLDLDTVEVDLACDKITPVSKEVASDETHSQHQPEIHSSLVSNEQSDDLAVLEEQSAYLAVLEEKNLKDQKTYPESVCEQNQSMPSIIEPLEVKFGDQENSLQIQFKDLAFDVAHKNHNIEVLGTSSDNVMQNEEEQKLYTTEKATNQEDKSPNPEYDQSHSNLNTAVMPITGANKETEMLHLGKAKNSDIEDFSLSDPPEKLQIGNNDEETQEEEQQMDLVSKLRTESQSFESAKQQDGKHDVQVVDVPIAYYQEEGDNMRSEQVFERAYESACSNFTKSQEATLSTASDEQETKDEEQEAQPVDILTALTSENRDHDSGLLHIAPDAAQTSTQDFTTDEEGREVDRTDVPAEGKHEKQSEQAPGNSTQIASEELLESKAHETKQASEHDPESQEEQDLKVKDMPAESNREAPEHEEDADVVAHTQKAAENKEVQDVPLSKALELVQFFEQLNTAKPDKTKQELMHPLDLVKENQRVDLIAEPCLEPRNLKE